ncbi:uncharacterized protein LOC117324811 [Pecten maximus]|uniref:uncharacterized protein LOC117324811 n=1 Tax=Pecten maximus TaxID=6579 RepID=UPI00145907BE|nr:uncharacterized protein LOC117324811 [Pecten maximus]
MWKDHFRTFTAVCGILQYLWWGCFGSDIKSIHYRIDERYANRIPQKGILWTKNNILVRWCVYTCLRDVNCAIIFFNNGVCYGYSEKLHDMILTTAVPGTTYYELAGPIGNLAGGKAVIQSSTYQNSMNFGPKKAVDAIRYPHANANLLLACAHTSFKREDGNNDNFPFWEVNLGSRCLVLSVSFLSRIDCCGIRNERLRITIAETASGPRALCKYYPGPAFAGEMKTFFCEKPLYGQFVRISRDRTYISACEVEVYGYPLN